VKVKLTVDSRISFKYGNLSRTDPACLVDLEKTFTYSNPEFYKIKSMGYKPYKNGKKIPMKIRSYNKGRKFIHFSRGSLRRLKRILRKHGHKIIMYDERLSFPPVDFGSKIKLKPEQEKPVARMLMKEQGCVRGPCSSGKTVMLLEAIARAKQPAVVVVWDTNLQKQWIAEAEKFLTLRSGEIGGCGGIFKTRKFGKLNICMQQSLWKPDNLAFFSDRVGTVAGDEVQRFAANTFQVSINDFPAKNRWGASASEKRKDGKHFLIYDTFGKVIHQIEDKGIASRFESKVFLIPTGFRSEDYDETGDHTAVITDITEDRDRNKLVLRAIKRSLAKGKLCLVLTERRAHALRILFKLKKYRTGILVGDAPPKAIKEAMWPDRWKNFMLQLDNAAEFERIKVVGEQRNLDVIVGTQKGNIGLNIRTIDHTFIVTPTGTNIELFNQQKGRGERDHNERLVKLFGKKARPHTYYFWDTGISKFQDAGNRVMKAYPGTGILRLKNRKVVKHGKEKEGS